MLRNAFYAVGAAIVVILAAILSVTLFFVIIGIMIALVIVRLVGEFTWMRGQNRGPFGTRGPGDPFSGGRSAPKEGEVIEGEVIEAHWADETNRTKPHGGPRDDPPDGERRG